MNNLGMLFYKSCPLREIALIERQPHLIIKKDLMAPAMEIRKKNIDETPKRF